MSMPRETYLHGHHRTVISAHSARTADDAAAFLLPHLQPGMSVLDFGCGPGTITIGLADAVGETGSVLGVDVSDGLCATNGRSASKNRERRTSSFALTTSTRPISIRISSMLSMRTRYCNT